MVVSLNSRLESNKEEDRRPGHGRGVSGENVASTRPCSPSETERKGSVLSTPLPALCLQKRDKKDKNKYENANIYIHKKRNVKCAPRGQTRNRTHPTPTEGAVV